MRRTLSPLVVLVVIAMMARIRGLARPAAHSVANDDIPPASREALDRDLITSIQPL